MSDLQDRLDRAGDALRAIEVDSPAWQHVVARHHTVRRASVGALAVVAVVIGSLGAARLQESESQRTIAADDSALALSRGLPRFGTFTYAVTIHRGTQIHEGSLYPGGPVKPARTLSEEDSYDEVVRNTRAGNGVRSTTGGVTGPSSWTQYEVHDGALVETAFGDEQGFVCPWEPALVVLPPGPHSVNTSWTSTARCEGQPEGSVDLLVRDRTVTTKVLALESWRHGETTYDALRLERRTADRGGSTTIEKILFVPEFMIEAEIDATYEWRSANSDTTNTWTKNLTELDFAVPEAVTAAPTTTVPVDPGDVSPARAGEYNYLFVNHTGDSGIVRSTYGEPRHVGEVIEQSLEVVGGGRDEKSTIEWRNDGQYFTNTDFIRDGATWNCTWSPHLVERRIPMALGTSWTSETSCPVDVGGVQAVMRRAVTGSVIRATRIQIGGAHVEIWEYEWTDRLESPRGVQVQEGTVWFSPRHGLQVRSVGTMTQTDAQGTTTTRQFKRELLSLEPG